jgi:hypothetical protein
VVSWYLSSTEAQPVLINNVTSATVFTIANLCSQVGLQYLLAKCVLKARLIYLGSVTQTNIVVYRLTVIA